MRQTQLSIFINRDTVIEASRVNGGTVVLALDPADYGTLNVFLDSSSKSKAGALAVLARLTAAVEALPDDTHAGQDHLPMCTVCGEPECDGRGNVRRGPPLVWRTLTFGDLRAGDVVRLSEDGPEETVRSSTNVTGFDLDWWYRTDLSCGYVLNADLVLVRHPRPEVGQ